MVASAAAFAAGAGGKPALASDLAALSARLCAATVSVHVGSRGRVRGSGSGVIWRPDGWIITNAHVALGRRATVELTDGRTLAARLMARDEERDLALLEVDAGHLPAPLIRSAEALRVGELAVAVGSPFGMTGSMAVGIVHAIGRDGDGVRWIGADLSLMPGNSGGPLADAAGRLIGINTMVARGLGIAIAVDRVAHFLREHEKRSARVA